MLRFKKSLAALLMLTMVVGVAGCGNGASESPSTSTSPSTSASESASTSASESTSEMTSESTSESTPPAEKTKIQVWSWWGSEARKPVITHIVDYFNENSDTVTAEYIYTPYGDIFTKNLANIAAGTPADVMFGEMGNVPYRASEGQTENLSPLMERDGYSADQYQDAYMKGLIAEDGGYHALPFIIETRIMYYNVEHLKSVGVNVDDPAALPQTWDQMIELAYKLDIKNGDKYDRVGFLPLLGNGGWDAWFANADSGKGWYDNATDTVTINTPNKLEAANRIMSVHDHYTDAIVDEISASTQQGMVNPFGSGVISMIINNPTYARELNNDFPNLKYGTFLIPEFKEGTGHWSNGGGFVVEIPKGAKHIDASWEFVKYMTSAYAQKYWSTNCFELSALKELESDTELKADVVYSTALIAAETTDPGALPNSLFGWKDYLTPNLDLVKIRQMTPADALVKAQKDVEDLKARQTK